jgi:TPR repeat protein
MEDDQFERGVQAERARDYRAAMDAYFQCLAKGDGRANAAIGLLHRRGKGVCEDKGQALSWFKKGMEANDPRSFTHYASMLNKGEGIPRDKKAAFELYQKAIALNDAWALTNVGALYLHGNGVTQDYGRALDYYSRAAALGDSAAMSAIGNMHEKGRGVPKSLRTALHWYKRASEEGDGSAAGQAERRVGLLYHRGLDGTPEYACAAIWYRKGAEHDDGLCHHNLGSLHEFGRLSSQPNLEEALRHYEIAGALGLPEALYDAARMHLELLAHHRGALAHVVPLLERAAEGGFIKAYTKLGELFFEGNVVRRDRRRAKMLYEKASALGEGWASRNLGYMYRKGEGVLFRNYGRAMRYFKLGAEQGSSGAMLQIGYLFAYGQGVRKDTLEALKWIRKAADLGNQAAKDTLTDYYSDGPSSSRADERDEYLDRLNSRVGELEDATANAEPDGRRRRINPSTGVFEVDGFFGWTDDTDSSGKRNRIDPVTGVIEEDSWLGWVPKS